MIVEAASLWHNRSAYASRRYSRAVFGFARRAGMKNRETVSVEA